MKVELRPRRELREKVDPLTGRAVLGADGSPVTEPLLPSERAIWVTPEDETEPPRHVGYVDVGKRNPINILPPITIGVPMLEWPVHWVKDVCDAVCMQLDGRAGSRPCSYLRDYVTPDEEEILEELLAEERAQQRARESEIE